MAFLPREKSKAAEKQWYADANRLGVSNTSIYDIQTYKSASKIEEQQFLALRALWVRVTREEFDPEQWGIVNVGNTRTLLNGLPFWKDYVNEIKSSPSGPSLPKTPHISPLADVLSTPESAHSEYIEDSKFSRLQDEQIVNTALISFASVLTYSVQGVNGHWSLQRKAFTFGEGRSKLYEARTDGHLFSTTNPQTSKAIVETKKQLRNEIPDVRRQEAAQMAAWIFSEPTEHQIVSRPSWNGYRRYMVSQDRHTIYLIVAEYNSDYIMYLRDPEYNSTCSFMTMFECGPWDVSVKNHMVHLGAILLAMTLQLT
ncbi:hypothetical protein FQN50_002246 [Emmonsiellopsis sp. PD_5]|nr:hypothetical protein FQN50_002246 [Emmonsiellopsis sp. PD_5]